MRIQKAFNYNLQNEVKSQLLSSNFIKGEQIEFSQKITGQATVNVRVNQV